MSARLRARTAAIAAAVVVASVLASCGSSSSAGGSASADDSNAPFDPAGVVHTQFDINQVGGLDFDPLTRAPGYFILQEYVYDTLLHRTPSGVFEPGLAKSVKILDSKTLEVVLRPDLKFSDGAPLDSEALKLGLLRNANSKSVSFRSDVFEISDVQVVDNVTSKIMLKSASAGAVYAMMAYPETFLVSPKAIAAGVDLKAHPVGAGPFVLDSLEPGVIARFRKNPTYYGAKDLKLGGIDIAHTATGGNGYLNGFLSGQFDLATIDLTQIDAAKAAPNAKVDVSTGTTYGMIYWCKGKAPLNDVRVRQALSLATNRKDIVDVIQGGYGTPAWGLWPEQSKLFVKDLENIYAYDLTKAKALLADAGYANGFTIESFAAPGTAQKTGELLQAAWAKLGVTLKLVTTNDYVGDFFTNAKAPMWISGWSGAGNRRITRLYGPGQLPNVCQYKDDKLNALSDQLKAIDETTPQGIQIWKDMATIVTKDVLSMNLAWTPTATAYKTDKLGGFEMVESASAGLTFNTFKLFVKK
jgi:ABC-type transport system substrate-binding protein